MNNQKEWPVYLFKLEKECKWNKAIAFMEKIINDDPDDVWAYVSLLYLLMDLMVENHPEIDYEGMEEYYMPTAKKYFWESYSKFCNDSEYLYYMAISVNLSPWYLDVSDELMNDMFERAEEAEPDNPVYQLHKYKEISEKDPENEEVYNIVQLNISKNSPTIKILTDKGSIGEYLLRLRMNGFCDIAERYEAIKNEKKRSVWQQKVDFMIIKKELHDALSFVERVCQHDQEDVWPYIYIVYILGELIREDTVTPQMHEIYKNKINSYFILSWQKFFDQFEYLLFMSIIAFYNKDGIDKKCEIYNEMISHAFFITHHARGNYSFFYYLINPTEKIEYWRFYYAQDIILYKNYLDREFLQTGALRPYIIQCIQDASKVVIERYQKEHPIVT